MLRRSSVALAVFAGREVSLVSALLLGLATPQLVHLVGVELAGHGQHRLGALPVAAAGQGGAEGEGGVQVLVPGLDVLAHQRRRLGRAPALQEQLGQLQAGAPIPGIITSVNVSVGTKVAKGDKLMTMEAMKMQMTIYAGADGVVAEICAQVGEGVESKDLLAKLRV